MNSVIGESLSSRPISADAAALEPKKTLSTFDAIAMIVGIVIGAGIFRTPSLVAANAGSELGVILLWCVGGVISLIGALCYAELTSAYPNAGGDYHFLKRAFGDSPAFLFAWARVAVIQTGSVAMMAFIIGDYLTQVFSLGGYSSSVYAIAAVVVLTAVNAVGIREGKWTQNVLSIVLVTGLLLVIGAAFFVSRTPGTMEPPATIQSGAYGMAMIFVLLTYGGWNEAAYLSAEVRRGEEKRSRMVTALIAGIFVITLIYVAVNIAFLRGLGLAGVAGSQAVAADLMRVASGDTGAGVISMLIAVAALSTMNVTMITGARSTYALGKDYPMFAFLGRWRAEGSTPVNALVLQGCVSAGLVLLGTFARSGFQLMVEYTAPVFWFFFLLVGVSLFVLRRKEPEIPRPFRVPMYPITPLLFCAVCAYMLHSSVIYSGFGALFGIAILLCGLPLLFLARRNRPPLLTNTTSEIMRHLRVLVTLCSMVIGGPAGGQPFAENIATSTTPVQFSSDDIFKADLRLAQAPEVATQDAVKPDIHYVPTPQRLVDVMLLMAEVNKNDLLYDLGSGDGRLVITAAKIYGARGIGIDIDPERIAEAKANAAAAKLEDKVQFWQQDLFTSNFRDATVITLYLLDALNERLRPQLFEQVKPGTRVVSHAFRMGDWEPDAEKTLKIRGSEYSAYFWVVPANMSGRWKITGATGVKGMPETVFVEQTFQKVALRTAEGGEVIGEGRLHGNEFTITLSKTAAGKPMTFIGTVVGNTIKAAAPGQKASWKAEREAGSEKRLDPRP